MKRAARVAAIALLMTAGAGAADLIDRVLAVVNGNVITQSDAHAALEFGLVSQPAEGEDPLRTTLEQMIRREVILAEVNRYSVGEGDQSGVDRKMASIRSRYSSDADYRAALARSAMTEVRLRDIVDSDVRIEDYMRQRFGAVAEPTDEEVVEYFNTHRSEFVRDGRQMTLEEARPEARKRLADERRTRVIDEWVSRLRRRADVTVVYFGGVAKPGRD